MMGGGKLFCPICLVYNHREAPETQMAKAELERKAENSLSTSYTTWHDLLMKCNGYCNSMDCLNEGMPLKKPVKAADLVSFAEDSFQAEYHNYCDTNYIQVPCQKFKEKRSLAKNQWGSLSLRWHSTPTDGSFGAGIINWVYPFIVTRWLRIPDGPMLSLRQLLLEVAVWFRKLRTLACLDYSFTHIAFVVRSSNIMGMTFYRVKQISHRERKRMKPILSSSSADSIYNVSD